MNWLYELLMYQPETVTDIRIGMVAVGATLVLTALGVKLLRRKDRVLISDRVAVRLFAVALVVFPISCMMAAGTTHCDFVSFQVLSSVVLTMAGTVVAIRAKLKWYIWVYVFLLLLFGSLMPAT